MTIHTLNSTEEITVNGITVKNPNVTNVFVFDIPNNLHTKFPVTLGNRWVRDVGQGFFIVEYHDEQSRDSDANIFAQFPHANNSSAISETEYQIPENAGTFEYENSYFLILNAKQNQLQGMNTSFAINGVVIDIEKYTAKNKPPTQSLGEVTNRSIAGIFPKS